MEVDDLLLSGRHPLVEIVVDSYVKSDSSLLGGRGVGWEEGLDEDERSRYLMPVEEGCLNPNHSMIIVTVRPYSLRGSRLNQRGRERITAGRVSSSNRPRFSRTWPISVRLICSSSFSADLGA